MLSRDLLRVRQRGEALEPIWLGHSPGISALAQQLLDLWRGSLGGSRGDIEDLLPPIIHGSRSQVIARGLNKIVVDGCRFDEGTGLSDIRAAAFAASSDALRGNPAVQSEQHRQQVLAAIAGDFSLDHEDPAALYADLPHRARLREAVPWSAHELIDRYNLQLAQGLLLSAQGLQISLHDRDIGLRRRLLKALRWNRLLATVGEDDDGALVLGVTGPGGVLNQQTRYGLQLANFLPHLCTAKSWKLRAEIRAPRTREAGWLTLSNGDPLSGHSHFLSYTPPEFSQLCAHLRDKLPQWTVSDEAPLLPMGDGDVAVPDLLLSHPQLGSYSVECIHRWHGSVLSRRLAQLAAGRAPQLLLAIDRSLARQSAHAEALAQPALSERHFPFTDFPTASALKRLLKQRTND